MENLMEGTRNLKYAAYDSALKDFFIYVTWCWT